MATSTLGSGTLVLAGTTSGTTTVTATAVAGTTTLTLPAATDTLVGKATTDTLTNKTLTGAVMNGTLGATTPSTVAATTLTTSSTVTHNGGTANGVGYLDGSKVLTTGSALVFDGTNLGVGVTPSAWYYPAVSLANGSFYSRPDPSSGIAANAYSSTSGGGWKYTASAAATRYEQSAGSHAWSTAASGTAGNAISFTQAMTLDASGNLLVGTTSAAGKVTFAGSGTASQTLTINGTTTGANFARFTSTGADGVLGIESSVGSNILANSSANATVLYTVGATSLQFGTNSTTRATIDSSGNLLVGTTTSPPSAGGCIATKGAGTSTYFTHGSNNLTGTTNFVVYNASNVGVYLVSGQTSWTANSDERLKTDLVLIENAAQKVSTLRAVTGRYKTDEEGVSRAFLIAQDVQAVLPQAVDASDPEKLGVQYTDVIPLLVAAIKEQSALITQLTARITALESA